MQQENPSKEYENPYAFKGTLHEFRNHPKITGRPLSKEEFLKSSFYDFEDNGNYIVTIEKKGPYTFIGCFPDLEYFNKYQELIGKGNINMDLFVVPKWFSF